MTLIVCLKAQDCVVMAADSLTTRGRIVTSCTTIKLHRIGAEAVTAGCGLSQVMGRDWGTVLSAFPPAPPGTAFATVVADLKAFLEVEIARISKSNAGATRGGNTFLVAGHDVSGPDMAVARLARHNIDYLFKPPVVASPPLVPGHIEWIGETAAVAAHIVSTDAGYAPGMAEHVAVDFAVSAIRGAILASIAAGNHTIGGDFVSVAVIAAGSVKLSRVPSGVPCLAASSSGGASTTI